MNKRGRLRPKKITHKSLDKKLNDKISLRRADVYAHTRDKGRNVNCNKTLAWVTIDDDDDDDFPLKKKKKARVIKLVHLSLARMFIRTAYIPQSDCYARVSCISNVGRRLLKNPRRGGRRSEKRFMVAIGISKDCLIGAYNRARAHLLVPWGRNLIGVCGFWVLFQLLRFVWLIWFLHAPDLKNSISKDFLICYVELIFGSLTRFFSFGYRGLK